MGIWVGLDDASAPIGHLVCPIRWQSDGETWDIGDVVTATTMKLYDRIFPLRMKQKGGDTNAFEGFVEAVLNPLFDLGEHSLGEPDPESEGDEPTADSGGEAQQYEVERVLHERKRNGAVQYKVKWKGYINRHNSWVDESDLDCSDLVREYHQSKVGLTQIEVVAMMASILSATGAANAMMETESPLPGLDTQRAVEVLLRRQSLRHEASEFKEGYETELRHMLEKRLTLLTPEEAREIVGKEHIVPMKMQLEPKKDGRRKSRLVLLGYLEPEEWDVGSNMSPASNPSTLRTMLYLGGGQDDVISMIDVSVAFLQSDDFGPDEPKRYVSYTPYAGGPVYVFRLRGPVYGARSAPIAWFRTLTNWLVNDMGYEQGRNDPCAFVKYGENTEERGNEKEVLHRLMVHVDDILSRGSPEQLEVFYNARIQST